jgi:phospholipase C
LPAVSFIKAATYQQGHPELSDPLKEQTFLVNTLNHLQNTPEWNSTAVIITYDDSDGWYDHLMPPIVSQSNDPKYDRLLGKDGLCGHAPAGAYQDRCGYGPRLPFLVVSPYAKVNYVDHSVTDQTSIIRFIEDNWGLKRIGDQSFDAKAGSILNMFNSTTNHHAAAKLFLDNSTGLEK